MNRGIDRVASRILGPPRNGTWLFSFSTELTPKNHDKRYCNLVTQLLDVVSVLEMKRSCTTAERTANGLLFLDRG